MDQQTYRDSAPFFDSDARPPSTALSEAVGESEAEYCRFRAGEELNRAREALHPAARAAHLEMAARYRDRMLGERSGEFAELQAHDPITQS